MDRMFRLFKFLLFFIPCGIMDGVRRILFDNVDIDEIFFGIVKIKPKAKKIKKSVKQKIIKEYLNDCLKIDYKA